jgi:hypothetical protein
MSYTRNAGWLDYPALSPETEARLDRIERQDSDKQQLIDAIRARRERATEDIDEPDPELACESRAK